MEKYTFKEKIYDYINSKAISEYCRKIKHEFSVVECVAIIRQSHCTLEEKFAAFNEIIGTMPDEKIDIDIDDPKSGERGKESIGIHEFLQIYMKSKKILIQEFKESDENYIYERYYDDGSEAGRYKDFQSCINAEVDDSLIRMKKRELYDDKGIYVTMNKNKEILHIWRSYYDYTKHTVKEIEVYFKYQTLAFPVPSPFKCGDIVYMKRGIRLFWINLITKWTISKNVRMINAIWWYMDISAKKTEPCIMIVFQTILTWSITTESWKMKSVF